MSDPVGRADLEIRVPRVPGGRARLGRDLDRLAAWLARTRERGLVLSFAVVSDREMSELHERYAGVAGPTDVLSFPLAEEPVLLGEVVVSADTARREARERGHSAYHELVLYAVHGSLHLVGHDDHDPTVRRRMRRAERTALEALGIPPVFGSRRTST